MEPYVRSQDNLLSLIQDQLDDGSNTRWTDARIYSAINKAIDTWHGRVLVPYVYTMTGGWTAGTFEYTLPDYMDVRYIQPQIRRYRDETAYYLAETGDGDTWADVMGFSVERNTSNGLTLRVDNSEYSMDGRILWWGSNGHVNTTPAVLGANITSSDTSLTTSDVPQNIGRVGYVKINSEWIGYQDVTEGTASWTLSNLSRGLFNTTAASHTTSDTIYFGVAVDTPRLFQQLENQAKAFLMEYYLTNSSSRETNHYEKQMVYYQDRADMFWKGYVSPRKTRMTLSRMAYG